jgi:hypothetical protein
LKAILECLNRDPVKNFLSKSRFDRQSTYQPNSFSQIPSYVTEMQSARWFAAGCMPLCSARFPCNLSDWRVFVSLFRTLKPPRAPPPFPSRARSPPRHSDPRPAIHGARGLRHFRRGQRHHRGFPETRRRYRGVAFADARCEFLLGAWFGCGASRVGCRVGERRLEEIRARAHLAARRSAAGEQNPEEETVQEPWVVAHRGASDVTHDPRFLFLGGC